MILEGKKKNGKINNSSNLKKSISISRKLASDTESSGEYDYKQKNKSLFQKLKNSKEHSKSIISKEDHLNNIPTLVEFRNHEIDKYVILKSNNTSYSNIINNNTNSLIDEYRSSRLGDSMLKMKGSFLNQNNSYSKENKSIRKNILYGQKNEDEKSSERLKSSVVYNSNRTNDINSTKNSKNDPQSNSNKLNFKGNQDKLWGLSNDFYLLSNNYSQLRESFKASIVSLALNNNLNNSNVNLDLSQSQIFLPTQREIQPTNFIGNSAPMNKSLNQRKDSDVTLSINPRQNKFRRFTNYYSSQPKRESSLEVVNNVCEFNYLKSSKNGSNSKNDDDNDECEISDTDEFVREKINIVKVIEVKENSLKNENSVINFNKILRKFYKNEPQLEILEKNLMSTSKKITEITKLEKLYQELSERLVNKKRTLETNHDEDNKNEIDIDLINKEIINYQNIFNNKCQIYQGLISKLNSVINNIKETSVEKEIKSKTIFHTDPNLSNTNNNNFITEMKSTHPNTHERSYEQENKEITNLIASFNKIDVNKLNCEVPIKYKDLMKKMCLIESNIEGDKKINVYSHQIIETVYPNKTIKRSFNDKYVLYIYENGDIKQVFPDKTKVYFYSKNKACEYNFEKVLGYKIVVFDINNYQQIYLDGTKISKKVNLNQLKIKRNNEILYF